MKYKISMSTYNLDIIEAFSVLGNKKTQFVEQALLNFLLTTKGKETLAMMTEHIGKVSRKAKGNSSRTGQMDGANNESGRVNIDNFLE